MLRIKPVPEGKAGEGIVPIYSEIKTTLGVATVPLVFQYMAAFPSYLSYVWKQAHQNLTDMFFQSQVTDIASFAQKAIEEIYTPSTPTVLFLEKLQGRAETVTLSRFVETLIAVNASLYLLSLAIRESLKGKYLGLKRIGERIDEEKDTLFTDVSEEFFKASGVKNQNIEKDQAATQALQHYQNTQLTTSLYKEFFTIMDWEMENLIKKEEYLTRRVELERFALSKLHLITNPLESSFATVSLHAAQDPTFPELLYLIAELFPTQAPYKLLTTSVMKKALTYDIIDSHSLVKHYD